MKLSHYRRADQQLFRIHTNPVGIEGLRKLLPYSGPADVNLCVSHAYRKWLIRTIQKARCLRGKRWMMSKEDKKYPHSQHLYVAVGDQLLSTETNGALLNGAFVTVLDLTENSIVVRDDESGDEARVPFPRFAEHFLSARAVTYQIVQAKTLRGSVALHQCDHKNFTDRHKLVGLSRGTAKRLVSVK